MCQFLDLRIITLFAWGFRLQEGVILPVVEHNPGRDGMGRSRQHAIIYARSRQLDLTRRETRLVLLHPGRWRDQIVCSLSTVSLDDNPEYEALSYAWGDATIPRFIKLNRHTVRIRKNL